MGVVRGVAALHDHVVPLLQNCTSPFLLTLCHPGIPLLATPSYYTPHILLLYSPFGFPICGHPLPPPSFWKTPAGHTLLLTPHILLLYSPFGFPICGHNAHRLQLVAIGIEELFQFFLTNIEGQVSHKQGIVTYICIEQYINKFRHSVPRSLSRGLAVHEHFNFLFHDSIEKLGIEE